MERSCARLDALIELRQSDIGRYGISSSDLRTKFYGLHAAARHKLNEEPASAGNAVLKKGFFALELSRSNRGIGGH